MQRLTIVKIVFVGFCDLLTFFGTYEQFISVLWNDFFIDNVRKCLWNSALVLAPEISHSFESFVS